MVAYKKLSSFHHSNKYYSKQPCHLICIAKLYRHLYFEQKWLWNNKAKLISISSFHIPRGLVGNIGDGGKIGAVGVEYSGAEYGDGAMGWSVCAVPNGNPITLL
jgi:hypothetical protein